MRTIKTIESDLMHYEGLVKNYKQSVVNYDQKICELKKELKKAKEANQLKAGHGDVFEHCGSKYFVVLKDGKLHTINSWGDPPTDNSFCIQQHYDSNSWKFQYNVFNPNKKKVGC